MQENFLAFDLGASSGRAVLGTFESNKLRLKEIHRFTNKPTNLLGTLYWNVLNIFDEIKESLSVYSQEYDKPLNSVGVDTWGVDFGLIGKNGKLLSNPVHYRDSRTDGMMEEVFKRVSRQEIFEHTGIQFMQLNTLYQLFSMSLANSPLLKIADVLLMMPDLFNYFLTGKKLSEFTIATTSQCYNILDDKWFDTLLERLNIPPEVMPQIVSPGTVIGEIMADIKEEVGLSKSSADISVVAPACHDTGSAVAAVPVQSDNWAYVSSGTWSLIGLEVKEPIINEKTLLLNFTNEGGVDETYRFLKNVTGLWLIQECKRIWEKEGETLTYEEITDLAEEAALFVAFVDPDDSSFLNPPDMPKAIMEFCQNTNQKKPQTKGEMARCVLESLALKCRYVLEMIYDIHGQIDILHIVGGGTKNKLLCQFTSNATGLPVIAGPVEATSIGNLMMQAKTKGLISSIEEGRQLVANSFELVTYEPQNIDAWDEAYQSFVSIINRQDLQD